MVVGDLNVKASSPEYYDLFFPNNAVTDQVESVKDDTAIAVATATNENKNPWHLQDFFSSAYSPSSSSSSSAHAAIDANEIDGECHTYDAEHNALVSIPEDSGRIDYVFGVTQLGCYSFLPLTCLTPSIVKHPRGQELSDHYPLVLQLLPSDKTTNDRKTGSN